eukprot:755712-Hanusia_phi.AAC.2
MTPLQVDTITGLNDKKKKKGRHEIVDEQSKRRMAMKCSLDRLDRKQCGRKQIRMIQKSRISFLVSSSTADHVFGLWDQCCGRVQTNTKKLNTNPNSKLPGLSTAQNLVDTKYSDQRELPNAHTRGLSAG